MVGIPDKTKEKLTNLEFIALIADTLQLKSSNATNFSFKNPSF